MQTKQILFGLVCYSLMLSAYADTSKKVDSTSSKPEDDCLLKNPASFRLSSYHREANGIGYTEGYTSFDGFFAFSNIGNLHPFFDIRLHLFNDWKVAANTGFGLRYQPEGVKAIFGVNGFFDFRRVHQTTFEQVGCGIEILGSLWEARANGYFPIIDRNNLYDISFLDFSGNQALFLAKSEVAFSGVDASIGRTLVKRQYFSLSATLGGYMFFADFDKEAKGGLFKLRTEISRYFSMEAQTSYDTLFRDIFQGQIGLSIPFGKRVKARKKGLACQTRINLADRLVEPVDRFEIIVADHHNVVTPALDPRTDEPLFIVFVDNLASGGDGTAEAPFATLLDAQNNSSPGEMIYVFAGTGNPVGMSSGITLQDRQWLQGSGKPFPATTAYGSEAVPAQTTNTPTISNASGDTVTLADDNIIAGFNLVSSSGNVIAGSGTSGFSGLYLNLAGTTLYDLSFTDVSGIISLKNIHSLSNNGLFLSSTDDVALSMQKSVFINRGSQNLDILVNGSAHSKVSLQANKFEGSTSGSTIASDGTATLDLTIEDNTFLNIQDLATSSLEISAATSSILAVVFEGNTYQGPSLLGFDFHTTDTATSLLYVQDNLGTYSGSSSTLATPFYFAVDSTATSSLLLQGNVANAKGYSLDNFASPGSTFYVQSPDLAITGVESLNSGTVSAIDVTYISYSPSSIPNLD